MYFFSGDQHFYHKNVIRYCSRPFSSVEEMNEALINNHNEVVTAKDTTIHAGDFAFTNSSEAAEKIIRRLNGQHIFLKGSHDNWMRSGKFYHEIWEKNIEGLYVVCCHYSLRVWPRSHYNSIHLYGHSHGKLPPIGKSWDVGVDNNNFYPVSFDRVKEIMLERPDNPNLIR